MKLISPSPEQGNYSSLRWHESRTVGGVRFATRRVSLAQRIELTERVTDLTIRHQFLKAGDASDQLEAALSDLLVGRLYLQWGLDDIQGLSIDGSPATVDLLIERGPEELANEVIAVLRSEIGLSDEERKNF